MECRSTNPQQISKMASLPPTHPPNEQIDWGMGVIVNHSRTTRKSFPGAKHHLWYIPKVLELWMAPAKAPVAHCGFVSSRPLDSTSTKRRTHDDRQSLRRTGRAPLPRNAPPLRRQDLLLCRWGVMQSRYSHKRIPARRQVPR